MHVYMLACYLAASPLCKSLCNLKGQSMTVPLMRSKFVWSECNNLQAPLAATCLQACAGHSPGKRKRRPPQQSPRHPEKSGPSQPELSPQARFQRLVLSTLCHRVHMTVKQ